MKTPLLKIVKKSAESLLFILFTLLLCLNVKIAQASVTIGTASTSGLAANPLTTSQNGIGIFGFSVTSTSTLTLYEADFFSNIAPSTYFSNFKLYVSTTNSLSAAVSAGTLSTTFFNTTTTGFSSIFTKTINANTPYYFFVVADFTLPTSSGTFQMSLNDVQSFFTTYNGVISGTNYTITPPPTITENTTTGGTAANPITGNQTNIAILGVGATANAGAATITAFSFTASQNILGYFPTISLYKSTSATFPGVTGTGVSLISSQTSPSSTALSFNVSQTIPSGSTYYYFLVVSYTETSTTPPANFEIDLNTITSTTTVNYTSKTGTNYTFSNGFDWIGGSGSTAFSKTDWNTAANWAQGSVPGAYDVANIGVNYFYRTNYPTVSTGTVTIGSVIFKLDINTGNGNYWTDEIVVSSGAKLIVNGDISLLGDYYTSRYVGLDQAILTGGGTVQAQNLNVNTAYTYATNGSGYYTLQFSNSGVTFNVLNNINLTSNYDAGPDKYPSQFYMVAGVTNVTGLIKTVNNGVGGIYGTSTIAFSSPTSTAPATLQLANAAALSLSSTGTNVVSFNVPYGTVEYSGAAQTVYTDLPITGLSPGPSYYSLKFSGSGAKTPNGTATNNLNVGGDFTNALTNDGSNYVTLTNTIVNFNGATAAPATQTLQGGIGAGTTFTNVNFSGLQPKNMTSGMFNVAGNGVLTMLTGSATLTAGTNNNTNVYDSYSGNDTRTYSYLTLLSTATSSATVAAIPSTTNIAGNVNVQRYITGNTNGASNYRGYRLLSNPVKMYTGSATALYQNIKYVKSTSYVKGSTGPAGGFDAAGNPNLYFFEDGLDPSNTSFTSGNFRGVNNIDTTTAGIPFYNCNYETGNFYLYPGEGFLFFFRGDRSVAPIATEAVPGYSPTSTVAYSTGILNQQNVKVRYWYSPGIPTNTNSLDYTVSSDNGNTTFPNNVVGFNLVGNPYASTIDLNSIGTSTSSGIQVTAIGTSGGSTGISPFVYELNPQTGNYGSYNFVTPASQGGATRYIASGQGFFVVANNSGNTLTFTENAKTTYQNVSGSTLLLAKREDALNTTMAKQQQDQHLRLTMAKDSVNTDDIYIGFDKAASTAFIVNEDAPYRYGEGQVSLNSRSSDNVQLAINMTALPKKGQVIPLSAYAVTDGTYTLKMTELKNIPVMYDVWLKDAYQKDSLDMRHNAVYTFNIAHADTNSFGKNRFTLFIKKDPAKDVHLLQFLANKGINAIITKWVVENEANYTAFALQKSTDGVSFATIDTLMSDNLGTYSFTDQRPQNSNYYRLQMTDVSGTVTYSAIVPVMYNSIAKAGSSSNISIYPNPTNSLINVAVSQVTIATSGLQNQTAAATAPVSGQSYDIRITNMTGEVLKSVNAVSANWQNNVSSLLPGTYIIQVFSHGSSSIVGRTTFVKL